MAEEKFSNESVKYTFSEDEKRDIATEMAQRIGELQRAEDDLKAVKSEFKSKIDLLQSQVNAAATQLNNGYEYRNMKCTVRYDVKNKVVRFYRCDTGELAKERGMYADEYQLKIMEDPK